MAIDRVSVTDQDVTAIDRVSVTDQDVTAIDQVSAIDQDAMAIDRVSVIDQDAMVIDQVSVAIDQKVVDSAADVTVDQDAMVIQEAASVAAVMVDVVLTVDQEEMMLVLVILHTLHIHQKRVKIATRIPTIKKKLNPSE
jgi:ABC-type transport system involved in cytochrome c biogenesis ATPase subunit